MADIVYYNVHKEFAEGDIDWVADANIKCALLKRSTHTPDIDDNFWDDVSAEELANGNGYTAGGVALTNKTVTAPVDQDKTIFDCDDISWDINTSTVSDIGYGVIYKDTGTPATSPLIYQFDFGQAIQVEAGLTFTIRIDANGLFTVA